MKTTGNTLSFWRVEKGKEEDDAILALLGTQDRIDKIDIVFIEESALADVAFENAPGDTVFAELRDLHVDVADLDHSSFMNTARALGIQIFADSTKRLTKADFRTRMQNALNGRRIAWESIPVAMQKDLKQPPD